MYKEKEEGRYDIMLQFSLIVKTKKSKKAALKKEINSPKKRNVNIR